MYSSYSVAAAICSAIFPVLAGIAVYLRFRARQTKSLPFKADDYLIIVALVFAIAIACIVFEGSFRGSIGENLGTLTPEQYTVLQKHLFWAVVMSQLSVGFFKASVITFYKRIFSTLKFKLAANIVLTAVCFWILAAFFTQIFSAWPVSNWWTFGKGFDMNYGAMVTSFAALDIFLDLVILCLPLPVIRKLNMSRTRKVQIIAIFWMGIFCVVAATVRLYYAYQLSFTATKPAVADGNGFLHISTSVLIWGQIEPCTSIIAACLPCLTGLVKETRSPESLIRSVRSIFKRSQGSSLVSFKQGDRAPTDVESQKEEVKREWHKLQEIGTKGAVYTGGGETRNSAQTRQSQEGIFMERSFAHTVDISSFK